VMKRSVFVALFVCTVVGDLSAQNNEQISPGAELIAYGTTLESHGFLQYFANGNGY